MAARRTVRMPATLLMNKNITASDKVLWAFLQEGLALKGVAKSIRGLALRTGLDRNTVRQGLTRLQAEGWVQRGLPGRRHVRPVKPARVTEPAALVPIDLLVARIRFQSKVIYACLLVNVGRNLRRGEIRYSALHRLAGVSYNTAKKAMRDLAATPWLDVSQASRYKPVVFVLRNPVHAKRLDEVAAARRRIDDAPFKGEQIMREILSAIIDSRYFEDNATPGFLVHPKTGQELQYDRYYIKHDAAFEFNGPQHYGATDMFSDKEAAVDQRIRDLVKIGLSVEEGTTLIVVRAEDLSLEEIRSLVEGILPLRDLTGHEPLIEYLKSISRRYRKAAA